MTRPQRRLFPALFVLALAVSGCDVSVGDGGFSMDFATGKAQDEWTRTYTVSAGGRLEIVNVNGTINVTPAESNQLEVRAVRIAKAGSDEAAREQLQQIDIAETATADRVRLETKVPRQRFGRHGHEVRYFVKMPNGLGATFETVNGGVRLENVEGRIVASTTNGGVRGSGLRGEVKASTTNGGVEIAMASVTGEIALETTNGGIRLRLPRDTKAELDARVTNGGIGVDESLGSLETVERSRRRLRGTLNGGGPRISAETTNGGVRISAH